MKKLLLLTIIIPILLFSDNISVEMHSGIPIGQWSDEVNTGYGFNIHYLKNTPYCNIFTGINLLSMNTDNILYTVNIISMPIGADLPITGNEYFTLSLGLYAAPMIINRRFGNAYEWGINECAGMFTGIEYIGMEQLKPSIRIGYERYKIINGENFIFLAFGLSFDYSVMLSGL